MIYLVFSRDGYESIQADLLADTATLWINQAVLQQAEHDQLTKAGIQVFLLPEQIRPGDDKAMMAALAFVEQQTDDPHILVEYL